MAWVDHFRHRAQATILHRNGRHIVSAGASTALFEILAAEQPHGALPGLRRQLISWGLRHGHNVLRRQEGEDRLWLNVGHTGLDLPGLPRWCEQVGVRPVLMVHDLIPLTHPQYCRDGEAIRHGQRMDTLLQISHAIIGNSQHTIDTLSTYAGERLLPMVQALAIWPGTEHLAQTGAHPAGENADFVILGTIEGRKNHRLLLDTWERLVAAQGAEAPRLVIIGRRGWACDDITALLDARSLGGRVLETGPLDDAQISAWLRGSRALLFPSFAEGYGLPLVEALAIGVPVIASDLPAFREIGQGVPELLSPVDTDAWLKAISDYAQPGSPRRAAQLNRLGGFSPPDWSTHFDRVERFLATL